MKTKTVPIERIIADPRTQARVLIDQEHVEELRAVLRAGGEFRDPVIVYHDGERYWLADGHHRFRAAEAARKKEILAEVRSGGLRDAMLHACGANTDHGLRRTNADKHHAVMILLGDPEWRKWSDRQIAKHAAVTHPFVAKIRRDMGGNGYHPDQYEREWAQLEADLEDLRLRIERIDAVEVEECAAIVRTATRLTREAMGLQLRTQCELGKALRRAEEIEIPPGVFQKPGAIEAIIQLCEKRIEVLSGEIAGPSA